jgi:hypothetical protein
MKKTVYVRAHGNDEQDGLSSDRPVRSGRRAREVHYKQKAEEYDIRGTAEFVARVKAELNKCRLK